MKFLINNFIIIIFVGVFIIFALIGYLIESSKNYTKTKDKLIESELNEDILNNILLEKDSTDEQKKDIEEKNDEIDEDILNVYNNIDFK